MDSGTAMARRDCYRSGAVDAANAALLCDDSELRDVYLSIAKTWDALADKLAREIAAKRHSPRP